MVQVLQACLDPTADPKCKVLWGGRAGSRPYLVYCWVKDWKKVELMGEADDREKWLRKRKDRGMEVFEDLVETFSPT